MPLTARTKCIHTPNSYSTSILTHNVYAHILFTYIYFIIIDIERHKLKVGFLFSTCFLITNKNSYFIKAYIGVGIFVVMKGLAFCYTYIKTFIYI